ncbi:hypothetical protein A2Y99_01520 [Candidatus Gottesmanbacteria bacterium RBG_13_37_7]|uniref:Uncharacterized protein n=1 Tax=Candidatus Gottesmanbacteria bacterium RBG_13_37_7 TaxID=1798369 RepID=A0A1F5YIK5_9BACT|nr:MAG: hypothetical protein A2Y99_01520 [Candidatus Gottesmanbacteria bacterium RBG_13_37_7]
MEKKAVSISVQNIWELGLNILLPVFAFSIPFLLSGPQLLTGTVVNTLLYVASAKQISRKNLYLISLFPSLGAVSNGIIFGRFTPYLLFFTPSIWLGNMVLILSFQKFKSSLTYPFSIIFPSILKTSVLYLSALIFTKIHLVPPIFISSMGAVQLITSLMGGTFAFMLFKTAKRKI